MAILPPVLVSSLAAIYAYFSVRSALGNRARTDEQRALVRKQVFWTTVITFVAVLITGFLILPSHGELTWW